MIKGMCLLLTDSLKLLYAMNSLYIHTAKFIVAAMNKRKLNLYNLNVADVGNIFSGAGNCGEKELGFQIF